MSAMAIISVLFALAMLIGVGLVSRRVRLDLGEERRRGLNRGADAGMSDSKPRLMTGLMLGLLFGLGPGLSFLIGYLAAAVPAEQKIFIATAVFMATVVALMFANRIPKRKLRPLPWSALLVVLMGSLTLWLHDDIFIKIRPTLLYAALAFLATADLVPPSRLIETALGKYALHFGAVGQRNMVLIVIVFGVGMALFNELVRRNSSDLFWISFQIWGPILGFALLLPIIATMTRHHSSGQRTTGFE